MTQEALKLALEALGRSVATCFDQYAHQQVMSQPDHFINQAITAIKEALRENAMREVQRLGQEIEQEPVAYLVLFEGAGKLLEFKKGNYIHGAKVEHIPLYAKPQIEVGCAECGVNGGHALYCVACAEKFVGGYKNSGVPAVETGLEQVSPDTPPQRTEPVAWLEPEWGEKICPEVGFEATTTSDHPRDLCWIPLYPHPPQRTWVGLTESERRLINFQWQDGNGTAPEIIDLVEAKLKQKNMENT